MTLTAVLSLAAAGTSRAQSESRKAAPPPPTVQIEVPSTRIPVDQGRLVGGTYSNDFFGFSFTVKPGWVAVDAATRKSLMKEGQAIVQEGIDARKKAQIDAAMTRTSILINVMKYDVTTPRPEFNAALICLAERVPTAIIKTGEDYIKASLRAFHGTNAKMELTGPMRAAKIGGATFTVADVKLTAGARAVAQRYYVRLMKGYALGFVYAYADDEDLEAFDEMIKTVRFK